MSNINVAPYYTNLINKEIEGGKYRNEVEVIQAGLELLEKEHLQNKIIEEALMKGEESGYAIPFDHEKFKIDMKSKYNT